MAPRKKTEKAEEVKPEKKAKKKKKTQEDIEAEMVSLEQEKAELHLEDEKAKFDSIKCLNCGTKLELAVKDHMVPGMVAREYVCTNCERVNKIITNYPGPVDMNTVEFEQILLDFVWLERPPSALTEEQVITLTKYWAGLAEEGSVQMNAREQILFRAIKILLEKE